MNSMIVPKKKATNDQQHFVSLDVLSVGGAGGGGTTPDDDDPPSLFLSIWQESTTKDKPVGEFGKLLSRYALSGTLNSRVVADQRYRIGSVKALFVGAAAAPVASASASSSATTTAASTNESPCSSIEAIISLLYALAQSGSEELVVVAPSSRAERHEAGVVGQEEAKSKIQDAVELLHGARAYPKVNICELVQTDMRDCFWWRVFEDETSIVHAHWSTNIGLVYLFTLRDCLSRNADDDTGQGTSLLFLPEHANIGPCRDIFGDITAPKCAMPVFEEYPTTSGGAPAAATTTTARLWCVVVVAKTVPAAGTVDRDGWIFLNMESSQPTKHSNHHHHHRLLRRGFQQQERWKRIYPSLWKDGYFPWYQSPNDGGRDDDSDTSLIGKTILMSQFGNKAATFCIVDRLVVGSNVDASTSSNETKMNADEASVRRFFLSSKSLSADDANEICLDDSDDDDDENENKEWDMFLQVLGTGCAAPSPHRNASAQVLVLDGRSILLDAGEGTALQWDRYLPPQTSIGSVGIIWISHAHWDHFGGTYIVVIGVSVSIDSLTALDRTDRCTTENLPGTPSDKPRSSQALSRRESVRCGTAFNIAIS
jgi:hypothetical protein